MLSKTPSPNVKYIDLEYRRIFNFLQIFRAASIVYAMVVFYVEKYSMSPWIWGMLIILIIYTALFIFFRNQVLDLLIEKPYFFILEIVVAVLALLVTNKPSIPFYNYSVSPILVGSMLFTLRTGMWTAAIFSFAQIASVTLNGYPIKSSSGAISMLLGEIFAYFIIAFFGNYLSKLVTEVFAQRKIIKAQAEREATIEERNRIAREMHDNLAQILAGIKFRSEALKDSSKSTPFAEYADSITVATKEGLQALREALFALREDTFESSLSDIITRYGREFASNIGFKITTDFKGEPPLSEATKAELFRICQEAIHNANKHSGKKEARISFALINGDFVASIEDKGNGFDYKVINRSGLGLKSMQERADKVGANLSLDSQVGVGTKVSINLPVNSLSEQFVLSEN